MHNTVHKNFRREVANAKKSKGTMSGLENIVKIKAGLQATIKTSSQLCNH